MVVGNGDIASVLRDRPDRLYFASGVSNSQETDEAEYKREVDLLSEQPRDAHLVYFSSLAIFYSRTRYTQHKLDMESMVRANFPKHTIVRLGNISWGTNPHTLLNYLRDHPNAEIRDEYRYVIDLDEFLHWMDLIPDWPCEMNMPGRRLKVKEIADEYCHVGLHTK
jgi:hypothetical protein